MKSLILTLAAAVAFSAGATAQTNSTDRAANGGGHMGNSGTGVNSGTLPPAGREGERRNYVPPVTATDNNNSGNMRPDDRTAAGERSGVGTTIGGMSRAEFDRMNAEGNRMVAAVTPTSTPLSKSDQKLMIQMAQGGMMQLQASKAAVGRVQREDVRILAQSEVEEQTAVSRKIMEIARAKGMTMNSEPTAAANQMLQRVQETTDIANLERFYVRKSGVNGHEDLMKTGEKIMREAQDPALKALAEATAPVIKMHMQVSQGVLDQMEKGMNKQDGSGANGRGR